MKIQFYADPGHGLAKVKRELLIELCIEDKISRFSYQKGKFVYLEEDRNLSLFWQKMEEKGEKVELVQHHSNGSSSIRSYDSYRPQGSVQ